MNGVFNQKPALHRYTVTWDISILLDFLCNLSPVKSLDLKCLTLKLLMLSLVLSGQRGQTMHLLDIRNMTLTSSRASFVIGDLAKTSRPGSHMAELSFLAYAPDRRLCIITVLNHYLERTLSLTLGSETPACVTLWRQLQTRFWDASPRASVQKQQPMVFSFFHRVFTNYCWFFLHDSTNE